MNRTCSKAMKNVRKIVSMKGRASTTLPQSILEHGNPASKPHYSKTEGHQNVDLSISEFPIDDTVGQYSLKMSSIHSDTKSQATECRIASPWYDFENCDDCMTRKTTQVLCNCQCLIFVLSEYMLNILNVAVYIIASSIKNLRRHCLARKAN